MLTPTIPALSGAGIEPRRHGLMAFVVEAEPVDDGAIGGEAKEPRARIACLRQRRDRADLDEAEARGEHRVGHFGVLVEARRKADRIRKGKPKHVHREAGIGLRDRRSSKPLRRRRDRQPVRPLRIEQAQHSRGAIGKAHAISSGKMCAPPAASGSACTPRTAEIGSAP